MKDSKWFFFLKIRNKGTLTPKTKCNKYNIYSNTNSLFSRKIKKSVENFTPEQISEYFSNWIWSTIAVIITNNYHVTWYMNNTGNSKDVRDNIKDILSIILILNVTINIYWLSWIRSKSNCNEKWCIKLNTWIIVSNAKFFRYVKAVLL